MKISIILTQVLKSMIIKAKNIVNNKLLRHPLTREEVELIVFRVLPVGFVKGSLGGWRVRWQNGKPVIYKKADVYNASLTSSSIKNRGQMSSAFRMAAALNKGLLKEIWKTADVEGRNSYTRLIKHFRKTLKGNIPSIENTITPPEHHFIINDEIDFDSKGTISIKNDLNPDTSYVIVLIPFKPIKSSLKDFEVISFNLKDESSIQLNAEQINLCKNYNKYIIYSVLVMDNEEGIYWSNTAVLKGDFIHSKRSYNIRKTIRYSISFIPEVRVTKPALRKIKQKAHPPPGRTAA